MTIRAPSAPARQLLTRMARGFWMALWLVGWLLCAGCAHPKRDGAASVESEAGDYSALALETFDAAWKVIYETHFDTNFNGVDWLALKEELRPQAAKATDAESLRIVLTGMLARLGQSHMTIIPAEVADKVDRTREPSTHEPNRGVDPEKPGQEGHVAPPATGDEDEEEGDGDVGMELRVIERRVLVFRADPEGPAWKAGARPGWVVRKIGAQSFDDLAELKGEGVDERKIEFLGWASASRRLSGVPGSKVTVEFLDGADQPVRLELTRRENPGQPSKIGNLPTLYARLLTEKLPMKTGGHAGWIHFNMFMIPISSGFARAMEEFKQESGVILDLRGNLGGIAGLVIGISGHFLDEIVSLGTMRFRGGELKFNTNPQRVSPSNAPTTPYAGPVAILVDAISLSAAEVFAGGMQDIGRVRVFGQTSGGQTLPALFDRLPNGDVLYHAFADFRTPSGVLLEGRGVVPDEPVPLTRDDLLAGKDPVIQAALEWIGTAGKEGAAR